MRKPLALATAIIITLALAACGTSARDYDGPAKADCIELERIDNAYSVFECQFTLRDTRRVSCIVVDGGVDCDWSHADGADNL